MTTTIPVAENWTRESYRALPAAQQPDWPDTAEYEAALNELRQWPPLVFAGETRTLLDRLAAAARGEAFLLQGGDCAEAFADVNANSIKARLKVLLQMAVVLAYAGEKPVVKVGRIAGQFAKPRSSPTEKVNGLELPTYRGDAVNSPDPNPAARRPDPKRLLSMYHAATATLNLVRAFMKGGYASLHRVHAWNTDFVSSSRQGHRYEALARHIDRALTFMRVIGLDPAIPEIQQSDFFTSHEALLLGYEEALTRQDSTRGGWYACSAHYLWLGDRTRQLDGAHVEFLRGVLNPIGVKVGPKHDPDEIIRLTEVLNPQNEWGRLTLITRFGAPHVEKLLPPLVRAIERAGRRVLWSCDPMHGNTYTTGSSYKTRSFQDILAEIHRFFEVHWAEGTVPGGIHFELTGEDVTECTGGGQDISEEDLQKNYLTQCDPRLNAAQSLEMAFQVAEMLRAHSDRPEPQTDSP